MRSKMLLKSFLQERLKKYPRAYFLFKLVKGDDKGLLKIADSYFQTAKPILVVEENLSGSPELYYVIYRGVKDQCYSGFFAMIRETMRFLAFSETLSLPPIIYWGKNVLYYNPSFDEKTENVFEYYFKPVTMSYAQWKSGRYNYIEASARDTRCVRKGTTEKNTYMQTEEEVQEYARLYKKYFALNEDTAAYLKKEIAGLFRKDERIIGVHVRGTDFKYQANNHPKFLGFSIFVQKVKELLEKNHYDKIFLATDDEEALELFQKEFGDKLVFYTDCSRSRGNLGVHISGKAVPYALGMEVLRDVYTLVACTSLVSGLSQVSYAARYIKISTGMHYEETNTVEMVLNQNGNHPYRVVQKELDEAKRKANR